MRRMVPWALAVALATVTGAVAVNQVLDGGQWNWWWAAPAVAATLVAVIATARLTPGPQAGGVDGARRMLAERVREQWDREIRIRQLDDPAPLAVRWRNTDRPVTDHPEHVLPRSGLTRRRRLEGRSDRVDEFADRFRDLPRRRLVIVGDPGSGKTTLAVLLLRDLLSRRGTGDPVPVLFGLSGWDPDTSPFTDWIADQLRTDHPGLRDAAFGPDAARALVTGHHILPVLDGLDEMPEHRRPKVISALNETLTADDGLILTCRIREYADAVEAPDGDVLTSAAVIEPAPLGPSDAAAYVTACLPPRPGPEWDALIAAVRNGSPLSSALTSPLTLWLLRTTYIDPRTDPAPLLAFETSEQISEHLLDHVVEALITANPPGNDDRHPFRPRRAWRPGAAERRLGYLARHLEDTRTRDLAWWRFPTDFGGDVAHRIAVALLVTVLAGLGTGAAAAVATGPDSPMTAGPITLAAVSAALIGAGVGALRRLGAVHTPAVLSLTPRLPGRLASLAEQIAAGLLLGLLLGVLVAFLVTTSDDQTIRIDDQYVLVPSPDGRGGTTWERARSPKSDEVEVSLGTGTWGAVAGTFAAAGGLIGLFRWAMRPVAHDQPSDPPDALRRDLRATGAALLAVPALGAVVGMVGAQSGEMLVGEVPEPAGVGTLVSVVVGAMVGFLGAGWACTAGAGYLGAVLRVRRPGGLPWRAMAFLEDAHRLGLLRRAGPVYQFRHAHLQEHFASRRD